MKDDFKKLIDDYMVDVVEGHLEVWKDRYYRKRISDIVYDLEMNYDWSADYDWAEYQLKREMDDDEKDIFQKAFIKTIRMRYHQ